MICVRPHVSEETATERASLTKPSHKAAIPVLRGKCSSSAASACLWTTNTTYPCGPVPVARRGGFSPFASARHLIVREDTQEQCGWTMEP
jgi:hypothetical protein